MVHQTVLVQMMQAISVERILEAGRSMGIVKFPLRLLYTFYVLATLIVFLGTVASVTMPINIFPQIDILVVTIIWQYTGLSTPGNGAAGHDLQRIFAVIEREWYPRHRSADVEWHFGPKNLLST
jgi:hypothetical protein